jgi:hypothetical protein
MSFPTDVDQIHALLYVYDRMKKIKCGEAAAKFGGGIAWENRNNNRVYTCPYGVEGCEHGVCRITSREMCMKMSQVPFNPVSGKPLPTKSCVEDKDCSNPTYDAKCSSDKKCVPKKSYLEWREKTGKCIIGNYALRKYCTIPSSRETHSVHGVTDVPPFSYNPDTGVCDITKEYCKWMGISFDSSDKNGNPNCKKELWDEIGEFAMGKTIFRTYKKGFSGGNFNPFYVHEMIVKSIIEGFENNPKDVMKLSDKKMMEKYTVLAKDFGGNGIHLYQIIWKSDLLKIDKNAKMVSIGFIADEIAEIYPEVIKKKDGFLFIVISHNQVKENPKLKRIYGTLLSSKWILDIINKTIERKSKV